ncbi:hypothetical protein LPJ81_004195 [Coemansia sp. IMI 209127]|nr:hypothetical protein LPJ81_004195 [Coemansia sp. IMI 209127]
MTSPATGAGYSALETTEHGGRSSSDSESSRTERPISQMGERGIYLMFLGMGLASLLPWNLFISASEFFRYQFSGSVHELTFQNSFSVAYMVGNFLSCLYAMVTVTKSNPNTRIFYGLVANTVVYVIGIFMPFMSEYRGSASFYIALAQLVTGAISSGMILNSLFAVVSHFPSSNSEGMLSGQAVAGMLATTAQLVTAYSVSPIEGSTSPTSVASNTGLLTRTIAYFSFAATVNVMLTVAFWNISRDTYYQSRSKLVSGPESSSYDSEQDELEIVFDTAQTPMHTLPSYGLFKRTFAQISGYVYATVACFALTLSVFPSVTALVGSVSGFKLLTEWHFFLYALGDFLGRRTAPSVPVTQVPTLILLALTRILFIPLFFVCNLVYSAWYTWIQSDGVFLGLVLLLGYSNGVVSTRAAMIAPSLTDQPSIAGSIISISISVGLALGSIFSWPVRAIGCLCSPL